MRIILFLKNSAEFLSAFTSRSSAKYQKAPDLPYSARRKQKAKTSLQRAKQFVFEMKKLL